MMIPNNEIQERKKTYARGRSVHLTATRYLIYTPVAPTVHRIWMQLDTLRPCSNFPDCFLY